MNTRTLFLVAVAAASFATGCKGAPASPFNTLQESPITVFRLQNFQDAPAATPGATGGSIIPGLPSIPGLPAIPPEFLPQVQQGQTMICQFLPPGSPGCTPGAGVGTPTTPAVQSTQQFYGFRIIGQAQVMDPAVRKDVINIFGYEKSFGIKKSQCLYPELGMSFGAPPQTTDLLVSFSCNQVQARNFQWPHMDNGLTDDTVKKLSAVIQKLFGGG